MQTLTTSILNRIEKKRQLKILTFPCHEGWQTLFAETGHEQHMLSMPGVKTWDFQTRPLPKNAYIIKLDKIEDFVPTENYDIVLSQNRLQQHGFMASTAMRYNIPMIQIDHTEPPPGIVGDYSAQLRSMRGLSANVFITEYNRNSWGGLPDDPVIPHGINTDLFRGWHGTEAQGISIVNFFPQRDVFCGWNLWQSISKIVPVKLVGENPGLSKSINDLPELVAALCSARFFLNTSQLSPVPLSMIEAMACGCPVVTTAKQEIPNIIQNGVNGIMSNEPAELVQGCLRLLEDPAYAKFLGDNARKTVMERFNIQQFVEKWNGVLYNAIDNYR